MGRMKLFVQFTEEQMQEIRNEHSDVCASLSEIEARATEARAGFAAEAKPLKERRKVLEEVKVKGGATMDVECEEREGLVNGQIEVVRLDTGEVVETYTPGGPDEVEDEKQPGLPFARPDAPRLLCSAMNEDGETWAITAGQADAAEREIAESGSARVEVEGDTHTVTRIVRGQACETCGVVGGDHRPECAELKAADEVIKGDGDESPDSYDPNDTSQVAAKIDEIEPPPDGPVRGVESATTKVKPKRGKRGAAGAEAE